MSPASSVASIGAAEGRKLIAHKVFDAGATMAAPTKDANLVYEIAFFQRSIFGNANIPLNEKRWSYGANAFAIQ